MKPNHILFLNAAVIAKALFFSDPKSSLTKKNSIEMFSNMPLLEFVVPKFASTAILSLGILTSLSDLKCSSIEGKLISTSNILTKSSSNSEFYYLRKALKDKVESCDKTELELETVKKDLTIATLREDDAFRQMKQSESAFKSMKSSSTNQQSSSAIKSAMHEKFKTLKSDRVNFRKAQQAKQNLQNRVYSLLERLKQENAALTQKEESVRSKFKEMKKSILVSRSQKHVQPFYFLLIMGIILGSYALFHLYSSNQSFRDRADSTGKFLNFTAVLASNATFSVNILIVDEINELSQRLDEAFLDLDLHFESPSFGTVVSGIFNEILNGTVPDVVSQLVLAEDLLARNERNRKYSDVFTSSQTDDYLVTSDAIRETLVHTTTEKRKEEIELLKVQKFAELETNIGIVEDCGVRPVTETKEMLIPETITSKKVVEELLKKSEQDERATVAVRIDVNVEAIHVAEELSTRSALVEEWATKSVPVTVDVAATRITDESLLKKVIDKGYTGQAARVAVETETVKAADELLSTRALDEEPAIQTARLATKVAEELLKKKALDERARQTTLVATTADKKAVAEEMLPKRVLDEEHSREVQRVAKRVAEEFLSKKKALGEERARQTARVEAEKAAKVAEVSKKRAQDERAMRAVRVAAESVAIRVVEELSKKRVLAMEQATELKRVAERIAEELLTKKVLDVERARQSARVAAKADATRVPDDLSKTRTLNEDGTTEKERIAAEAKGMRVAEELLSKGVFYIEQAKHEKQVVASRTVSYPTLTALITRASSKSSTIDNNSKLSTKKTKSTSDDMPSTSIGDFMAPVGTASENVPTRKVSHTVTATPAAAPTFLVLKESKPQVETKTTKSKATRLEPLRPAAFSYKQPVKANKSSTLDVSTPSPNSVPVSNSSSESIILTNSLEPVKKRKSK